MAPSAADLALDWIFDPAAVLLLVVTGGLYVLGLRRRGGRWPVRRTVAFGLGLVVLAVATCSGLGRYDTETFSAHAGQHALLGMLAPLLLVLGAPVTLALTASDRSTRTVLLRILHSAPLRFVTNPLVIWVVFGVTLVALYTSPLLEVTARNEAVHALVHLHVVVTGVLFCEVAIGADALPRALPHGARLLFVLFAVPFHAVVGLALLSGDDVLAPAAYESIDDQRIGAGVLWGAGELFGLVTAGFVLGRWMAAEERAGRREDRRLDALAATAVSE